MRLTTNALRASVVGGRLLPIEADQQVRRQADAFPADKQQQEVLGQHQHQHEEHEQVQVGEEAPVPLVLGHVADGVKMNEEADAGDHAQHDQGQVIDSERAIDGEASGLDPGPRCDRDLQQIVRPHEEPEIAEDERWRRRKEECDRSDTGARQAPAQRAVQQKSSEGKQRQKPEQACGHREGSRLRLILHQVDAVHVERLACAEDGDDDGEPTAASAAATTITKNTKICPWMAL